MSLQTRYRFLCQLARQLTRNVHGARRVHSRPADLQNPWPSSRNRVSGCVSKRSQCLSLGSERRQGQGQGQGQQQHRHVSSDSVQTEPSLEPCGMPLENLQARDIYKEAVNAVEPRYMVEQVLQFDAERRVLTVQGQSYAVDRNVFVVGMGKAVLGMARTLQDILGHHVAGGILSIPRGQREVLREKDKGHLLLPEDSQIQVYEGGSSHLPDAVAHQAALDIERLLLDRTEADLVIMLISGGGSALLPLPQEGISLDDLIAMTTLMYNNGAMVSEVNTLRKYVERLKGGKAATAAHPAKVVSLIISDVVGDSMRLIGSGPTVQDQVTAHQCTDILSRLGVGALMPRSITQHLRTKLGQERSLVRIQGMERGGGGGVWGEGAKGWLGEGGRGGAGGAGVQNVLVGSNLIACRAAAARALELGHVPYELTTAMTGEAGTIGATLAKLGVFMLLCFDRRQLDHLHPLSLELDIVGSGVTKQQVNDIIALVHTAANMGRHATIISGGEGVVSSMASGGVGVGVGVGGRNLEVALGASGELQRLFRLSRVRPHPSVTILSADTDGEDGTCPAAGAVVTENFQLEAEQEGLSCWEFLESHDSYNLFRGVRGGAHLVVTRMTGTNVMDIQVMVVRNPLIAPQRAQRL